MRLHLKNGSRGGAPKYRVYEIAEMLGITLGEMTALIARNGNFPKPSIGFGFNGVSPNQKKDYCKKSYYEKNEVFDWYKKVTEQA